MIKIEGLSNLILSRDLLPETGWIFCKNDLDKTSRCALNTAIFYIPENDDDEFFGEDNLANWLETSIFISILELREKNIKIPTIDDYAEAALHYLNIDDFLE